MKINCVYCNAMIATGNDCDVEEDIEFCVDEILCVDDDEIIVCPKCMKEIVLPSAKDDLFGYDYDEEDQDFEDLIYPW